MKNKKIISSLITIIPIAIVAILVSAVIALAVKNANACKIYEEYVREGGPERVKLIYADEEDGNVGEFESHAIQTDEQFDKTIAEIKDKIRAKYGQYQNLNWSKFDSATVKMTSSEREYIGAMYYKPTNTLYILENVTQINKYHQIIAHEFLHSLLEVDDSKRASLYMEGFTEYLAEQVFDSREACYINTYIFAEAYVAKYGLERAISDYMAGTAELDIDKKLGLPGVSQNIAALIYPIDVLREPHAYSQSVIADVYLHYVKALGVKVPARSQEYLTLMYAVSDVPESTIKYLSKIC